MAEQTINYGYGEAMFKNVDPKAVLKGVGKAAKGWWDEFSPGTMGAKELQSFENVVSRVKNNELRTKLQEMKGLVRGFGVVSGATALVVDGALATVPLAMKFQQWREVEYPAFMKKARKEAPERIIQREAGKRRYDPQVQSLAQKKRNEVMAVEQAVEQKYPGAVLHDFLTGSEGHRRLVALGETKAEAAIRREIKKGAAKMRREFKKDKTPLINEVANIAGRYKLQTAASMVGIGGLEAAAFAFRPAARFTELRMKAGEAVGSWVVDHIVNNIVKGPNSDIAPSAPKPVS